MDCGDGRVAGYGRHSQGLRFIGRAGADETPLGWVPRAKDFDLEDMDGFTAEHFNEAQSISMAEWKKEILVEDELLFQLHDSMPKELIFQRELLVARL